jgi:DNA-binding transcriptional MerR regulator
MMGHGIAETARLVGIPTTTLRYYEAARVISPPGRGPNGYRSYSERDVKRLQFIRRARQLDVSTDQLRELVHAWDTDRCATVQDRLSSIVATRTAETRGRIADLVELADDLQRLATKLRDEPVDGPCDDGCACASTEGPASAIAAIPMAQGPGPIACTLGQAAAARRVDEWRTLLTTSTARHAIDGGIAVLFSSDPATVSEIGRLAAAESECCSFFDFRLHLTGPTAELDIRAAPEARDIVTRLFGAPETHPDAVDGTPPRAGDTP